MKIASFRLRIALFSAALAGVAVTGFGGISYGLLYRSKLQTLDQEIQDSLLREAALPRPDSYWDLFVESRAFTYGDSSSANAVLFVVNNQKQIIHESEAWQAELNPQALFLPQPTIEGLDVNNFLRSSQPGDRPPRRDSSNPRPRPNPEALRKFTKVSNLVTRNIKNEQWRMGTSSSPFVQMAIAVNLEIIDREMAPIRNIFFLLIPIILSLVTIGAWWLSSDALKAIRNITQLIKNVTAKELDQRASTNGLDTEFIELVTVFNDMMSRLEKSFQQASRFSGDAAHELKTPLAILQGKIEQSMYQAPIGSEQQKIFSTLLDEVRRLSSITRKLLLLSLADAGKMGLQKIEINFSDLIKELLEDIDLMAPELTLEIDVANNLCIKVDRDLLTQVLQNLTTNAIKYNLPNGWIKVQARQKNNLISITISNASKDISTGDRHRIFDRFQRGDASRNRKVEGFGLGLSLSREIVRAHGGDLRIEPMQPGCTAFTLSLPVTTAKT
ncbi:MAG: two-component sensor histidine kinase [Limnothrix sp. RL_2_0]|nr:two-component sensor histidine kinase [Limnothrix sp. RL_2_0]